VLERTEERFGLKPQLLAADCAYGAAPMLNCLVGRSGSRRTSPSWDRSKREDGTFSREDFRCDQSTDTYTCPAGKKLTTTGRINAGGAIFYRSSLLDRARDVARSLASTEAFEQSRREHKRIEMRLAHLKRILRLGRLRLQGPRGAQDEFTLAAIAQNLSRMAKLIPTIAAAPA
jgi:hypothetical protein